MCSPASTNLPFRNAAYNEIIFGSGGGGGGGGG